MIRQIVDRCHVSDSNRTVLRYIISRLQAPCYRAWRRLPRSMRRQMMTQAFAIHAENRQLFIDMRF